MTWIGFKGRHFNRDIITLAIGYYFRFNLSYRDIVEIMADRGVSVNHTTIMRWVHHYGATLRAIKPVAKDGLMDLKAHQCSK